MKKTLSLLNIVLAAACFNGQALSASTEENFIYSKTCLDGDCIKKAEQVQYFDNLGRPKQVVDIRATPSGKDVVTHIVYDEFGRVAREYFPVPQSGTQNGALYADPLSHAAAIFGNEKIYTEKELELSPLGRIKKMIPAGNDWSGYPTNMTYAANKAGEVKKYTVATSWQENATFSELSEGTYGANQLMKNTVTDTDGHSTIEFRNGDGQTVLVRKNDGTKDLDTYYVYNEYGQQVVVIPPAAAVAAVSQAILDTLCYQYRYDGLGRMVEKKLPGKGWEYMVYDKADRLVLSQDTVMKSQGRWLMTKYDRYGRIVYTGIMAGGERVELQNSVSNTVVTESRNTGGFTKNGMTVDYSNDYFTTQLQAVLSVNYYDTYPQGAPSRPAQVLGHNSIGDDMGALLNTKNLPTASLLKNIENDSWTKSYIWYDEKSRAVGTYSVNHVGGYTKTESELDFAGVVKQTKSYHKRLITDTEKVITQIFEYDGQNRLKKHWHQVNGQPQELLSENIYDERSQLARKKTGNSLQVIDYTYNIRGTLTGINDPANLGSALFGYSLSYYNPADPAEGRYSGNISEVTWKTAADGVKRKYSYRYDALNRLTKGLYSEPGNTVPKDDFYNETVTYDISGNIKTLKRNGKNSLGLKTAIDDLTYDYAGNRMMSVKDDSQNYTGYPDISGNPIAYDDNGNMKDHKDKGILEIGYNILGLPDYVKFDKTYVPRVSLVGEGRFNVNTQYLYRADGTKLKKTYTYGSSANNTETATATEYLDGFQYEATSTTGKFTLGLKFVPTSEGYYDFEKNRYIYSYSDHLGNIRVSYFKNASGSAEVLEENNFYPFGLKHEGYNTQAGNPSYNYQYNGKELQKETGWNDYGARMYMSDIGRWGVMDPLAETTRRISPYNYAMDNPVMMVDPDGMKAMSPLGEPGTGQDPNSGWFMTRESSLEAMDKHLFPHLGGGGPDGGSTTFGQTQTFKNIMAYLAQPESGSGNYFQGINFTQFGAEDDCPKCPKPVKLGEEIGKQVLKPQTGFWEKLGGTRTWTDSNGNDYLVDSEGKIIMRAPLTGDVPIGPASNLKGLKSLFTFTKSAGKHITEFIKSGENAGRLARPYMRSSLTIQEIIATGKGIPDATAKGALNFRVPGTFRGSSGTWELVVDTNKNLIYHFNFVK